MSQGIDTIQLIAKYEIVQKMADEVKVDKKRRLNLKRLDMTE
jgi:hypothetical protein